jgi:uncharacterized protein
MTTCLRLLCLALLALPVAAGAASFDCAKAHTRVEKLICASPELGALDERLAAAFKAIGPEPEGNEWGRWAPRVDDQRRWLREVRDRCRDAACLRSAYLARVDVLGRWHAPGRVDDTLAGQYLVPHTVALVAEEDLEQISVDDCLALVPRKDGGFDLSIDSMHANAHMCSIRGRVRGDGDVLALEAGSTGDDESACALRIHIEQGELRIEDPDDACQSFCGARGHLGGLRFPRSTKQPGAPMQCNQFEQ